MGVKLMLMALQLSSWLLQVHAFTFSSRLLSRQFFVSTNNRDKETRTTSLLKHQMFSGIVEEIGEVVKLESNKQLAMWDGSIGEGVELTVRSSVAVEDAILGCSIAVNGVCLTATKIEADQFTVGLAPETLRRSNLALLQQGSKVNVERAMRVDGRNSGHFVQGHVDCTAKIIERWNEGDSIWIRMSIDDEFIKYIVPKGFVAIDGTSLTICEVHKTKSKSSRDASNNRFPHDNWFTIMMVPHTQQHVIFPLKQVGDLVNIEVDVLGKMVEQSLQNNLEQLYTNIDRLQDDLDTKESIIESLENRIKTLEGFHDL